MQRSQAIKKPLASVAVNLQHKKRCSCGKQIQHFIKCACRSGNCLRSWPVGSCCPYPAVRTAHRNSRLLRSQSIGENQSADRWSSLCHRHTSRDQVHTISAKVSHSMILQEWVTLQGTHSQTSAQLALISSENARRRIAQSVEKVQ
jgi:hypothetical protein